MAKLLKHLGIGNKKSSSASSSPSIETNRVKQPALNDPPIALPNVQQPQQVLIVNVAMEFFKNK